MSPGEYVIINIDPCQQGGNDLSGTLRKPSFSRLEEQFKCALPERAARLCRLPKQEPFGAIRQNWLLT